MRGLQRWKNKVAMVTGASGGIGEALASALAEQGMRVVLVARRKDRLEALAKRLRDGGAEVEFIVCDVGIESQVIEAFASVAKKWGGVDVLINNAGTGMMSRLEAGQWTDWCDTLKINVASYALCVREVLPQMKLKAEAQIINLSSLYAHRDQVANFSFYQASKFAVRAMTNTLRAELAQPTTHIRVGMISPGMVKIEGFVKIFLQAWSLQSLEVERPRVRLLTSLILKNFPPCFLRTLWMPRFTCSLPRRMYRCKIF